MLPPLPKKLYAVGFSARKRPFLRNLLPESHIQFSHSLRKIPDGSTVVVWGQQIPAQPENITIIRVEDGFLRSVGLGADLIRPLSWVIDRRGIYYDATQPSDLEHLLEYADFPQELLERAQQLQQLIVEKGLSKYNIGTTSALNFPDKQKKILVIGQVESDASIKKGGCGIKTNFDLIKEVRTANPNAYIIYKPHPDIEAGLRSKGVNEQLIDHYCENIIHNTSIIQLFDYVDEVHVITSLTGFEALLRNKIVYCYGHPFYAGWGLTKDALPTSRRTRRLSVLELVAATLILYPRYVSPQTNQLISVEDAIHTLLQQSKTNTTTPFWRYLFRPILRLLAEMQGRA